MNKNVFRVFLLFTLLTMANTANAVAAVVGVAIGAAAWGVGAAVSTAIAIGVGVASAYMAFTMKVPSAAQSQAELKQTVRMSRSPRNVAYGDVYSSGTMLFVEEQVGDSKNDDGTYDEWLYIALGMFNHPVESVNAVYLNDTDIAEFGEKAVHTFHNNDSGTDDTLLNGAPSWQDDMTGEGVAWSALSLRYDSELYSNGVPTLRLQCSGKNDLWDPRDDSYGYSNNAAIVILDFHLNYMGIDKSRIITEGFGSFIDAINLCDENVINADGSSSKRYTINGIFNLEETPLDVMTDMLAACGGMLVRVGGQYGLLPAAYQGPANFTITESDLIGNAEIQIEPSTQDAINTVKGTFVDPDQEYVETDYPSVVDESAYERDGGELSEDLSLRFVTDVYQAQRLASIVLKKSLAGGQISITTNYKGAYARLGRVVNLDMPTLNVTGEYRVVEYSGNLSDGFSLTLVREDVDIYDDAIGSEFIAPPLTNLPVGTVAVPTAVQFNVESIGEVVQGVVAWKINAPQSMSTDIRFKDYTTNEVIQVGSSIGSTYNVNGLAAGNYVVEVRTVARNGQTSSWVTTTFIIDVPPMPDSVTVNSSNWSIELIPVVNSGIPSGTLFEFVYLQDDASYLTDQPSYGEGDRLLGETVALTSSLNHGGRTPDRWCHYWVRGVNSYGESDWLYVQTGTTKEQDLVTTVVERLQAIEILSANWDEGDGYDGDYANGYGYKLFAPDPNDPSADGRAVFNDIYARGNIIAEFGEIENRMTVGNAYIDGRTYNKFLSTNNGKFWVNHNGKMYGSDVEIEGKITAEGGVYGALVLRESGIITLDEETLDDLVTHQIITDNAYIENNMGDYELPHSGTPGFAIDEDIIRNVPDTFLIKTGFIAGNFINESRTFIAVATRVGTWTYKSGKEETAWAGIDIISTLPIQHVQSDSTYNDAEIGITFKLKLNYMAVKRNESKIQWFLYEQLLNN